MTQMYSKYQFAVIATDTVIFTIQASALCVLLIKMKKNRFASTWALPGGLIKPDESVDEAAIRTLKETTGLENIFLEQLYTFGEIERDPSGRVVSVAYLALLPFGNPKIRDRGAREEMAWADIEKLPGLAYDHSAMIKHAVLRLRAKVEYTNIVRGLLPPFFTLTQLQKVYEIILQRKFDKRNFRKKILSLKLIRGTGRREQGAPHRPAELFHFRDEKYKIIQII